MAIAGPRSPIFPRDEDIQEESGSFQDKRQAAKLALPVILGKISRLGTFGLVGGALGSIASIVAIATGASNTVIYLIIFSLLTVLSLAAVSPILTILALRLVGYFRDNYRATNFGVSDLVELIRQIDNALIKTSPGESLAAQEAYWKNDRIKLSFIGHSMGGFVVTNTVRILSDVFDPSSVGSIDVTAPEKIPSPSIGNVFSLGRLVLVSPDIPAETIISGRANFLQSSLRRFELESAPENLTASQQQKVALSQILSSICRDKGIQVLLAQERYTLDVLEGVKQNIQNKL